MEALRFSRGAVVNGLVEIGVTVANGLLKVSVWCIQYDEAGVKALVVQWSQLLLMVELVVGAAVVNGLAGGPGGASVSGKSYVKAVAQGQGAVVNGLAEGPGGALNSGVLDGQGGVAQGPGGIPCPV